MTQSTTGNTRFHFNKKTAGISMDKKIALLKKAGYKIVQDLKWQQPK